MYMPINGVNCNTYICTQTIMKLGWAQVTGCIISKPTQTPVAMVIRRRAIQLQAAVHTPPVTKHE